MNITVARPQGDLPFSNRRAKGILPLSIALILHALALIVLLSTKAPPARPGEHAVEVSLVSGVDVRTALAPAQQVLKPLPPGPVVQSAAQSPTPAKTLKPGQAPPTLNLAKSDADDPTHLFTKLASGGPSLTAAPVNLTVPPTQVATTTSLIASGKSCQITAAVQAGLQGSQDVKLALSRIPAASLSVANAILLWDNHWIDQSSVGGAAAFEPVERAVVDAVNQAPIACQAEVTHGVRFVILARAQDTIVLAFGSGDWRWSDVAATFSITESN